MLRAGRRLGFALSLSAKRTLFLASGSSSLLSLLSSGLSLGLSSSNSSSSLASNFRPSSVSGGSYGVS